MKQSLSVKCCSRALKAISKGSVWSHKKNTDYDCCNRALRRSCKVRENVSKEEYTLSVTTFHGLGSTANKERDDTEVPSLF